MDTLALHVPVLFGASERPLAWAAAENRHRVEPARGDHGGSYRDNPRSSRNAARELVARNAYAGLPAYRDVRVLDGAVSPQLRYEIELAQPGSTIATSNVVLGGAATLVPGEQAKIAAPHYHGDSVYALSAAQVSFRRPAGRADRRQELANLFNPYWQARLAPVTLAQRMLAAAARGGAPDPYVILP